MSSRHLADLIRRRVPPSGVRFVDAVCTPTRERHDVQTDADVRREWFDAAIVVGLTAGTSTPHDLSDRVEARTRSGAGVAEGLR